MKRAEIITALLEQARDKDTLANYDPNSIFTFDANVLTEAALMLFAVNDWVSVKDALPPKDTDVLVWLESLNGIAVAQYDNDGEWLEADEMQHHAPCDALDAAAETAERRRERCLTRSPAHCAARPN